jgi:hypothetical protein
MISRQSSNEALKRLLHYHKLQSEELANVNGTLDRTTTIQAPRQRKITKREIPRLRDSGILTVWDANRSIADKKAKEEWNRKKADKTYKEAYGHLPPAPYTENNPSASDIGLAVEHADQLYFMDSTGVYW